MHAHALWRGGVCISVGDMSFCARPNECTGTSNTLKKPQKNFVVEYKAARRKPTSQSNSIWGNVDLRRFVEHDSEMEAPGSGGLRVESDAAQQEVSRVPALAAALQQKTPPILGLEEQMADETNMSEQVSTEPETALATAPEVGVGTRAVRNRTLRSNETGTMP